MTDETQATEGRQVSEPPTWRELAGALVAFAAQGDATRMDIADARLAYALIGADLVRREEIYKACRTCGQPRHDYSYWKITGAGRLLIAAYEEAPAAAPSPAIFDSEVHKDRTGREGSEIA